MLWSQRLWVDRLLADRRERVRQLQYPRHRLGQALRYLDNLFGEPGSAHGGQRPGAPTTRKAPSGSRPLYALCGKPYERAYGISPAGIAYAHRDGSEYRSESG